MANTTADKLAHLQSIKNGLKTSINGSGNIVGDVFADYPGAVDDFRSKVATAITAKGVATNATDTPDQMASNISEIKSGPEILTGTLLSGSVKYYWFDGETVNNEFGSFSEKRVAKNSLIFALITGQIGSFSVSGGNILAEYTLFSSEGALRTNIMIASITENNFMVSF